MELKTIGVEFILTVESKPDYMDYRVVAILQVMSRDKGLLSPKDVGRALRYHYGIRMKPLTVAAIMNQLASTGLLVRYSPTGIPSSPESAFYLGPRLVKTKG